MRHTKEVVVPQTTRVVETHRTCDICTEKITNRSFEVDQVTVSRRMGSQYPEGGMGQTESVDLCGKCFDFKLVPWLTSQGANITTTEWDN